MIYYAYILQNQAGRYYIGCTQNVAQRLAEHNSGISKWTKRYAGTWQVSWCRQFNSLGEARKFENLLKRQKGGDAFYKLTGLNRLTRPSAGS